MPTLATVGRAVRDTESKGKLKALAEGGFEILEAGEVTKRQLAGGTLICLEAARAVSADMNLEVIVESVADKNAPDVVAWAAKHHVDYDPALIHPDASRDISTTHWVYDGGNKERLEMVLPRPSGRFLGILQELKVFAEGDGVSFNSEFITDNWALFEDYAKANKANGARVFTNNNTRKKDNSLKQLYRNKLGDQLGVSDAAMMGNDDLGHIFNPADEMEVNLARFQDEFRAFKGILVLTCGGKEPLLLDMAAGEREWCVKPPELARIESTVGVGDKFAGDLMARILLTVPPGERLTIAHIKPLIADAHRAAAAHIAAPRGVESALGVPAPKPPGA